MRELGELDSRFAEFANRGVRIVAVSVDGQEDTARTQQRFPHLVVWGDPEHRLTNAVAALHEGKGPGHSDIAAPTTILLDKTGVVRWTFRPEHVIVRLTPDEVLAAVDEHLKPNWVPLSTSDR
jgi:peroxiredoxin